MRRLGYFKHEFRPNISLKQMSSKRDRVTTPLRSQLNFGKIAGKIPVNKNLILRHS